MREGKKFGFTVSITQLVWISDKENLLNTSGVCTVATSVVNSDFDSRLSNMLVALNEMSIDVYITNINAMSWWR